MKTITGIAQIFFENVTTELSVGNLAWFAQQAIFGNSEGKKLDMSSVTFLTMPWVAANGVWSRTYNNHPSYVAPDVDEVVEVVNEYFNPYVEDLRKDELDIMYVNDDGTLGCTSGVLEDTKYNSWVKGKNSGSSSSSSSGSSSSGSTPSASTSPSPSASASASPSTSPSTSPSPSPSESTAPSTPPSVTPSPSPSESVTPSPSPSETQPAVSETPSPSPSESVSPSPSPSESGGTDQPPEGIPIYTPDPVATETAPAA